MEVWEQIDGAKEFVDWFGGWPAFHDAELLHLHLNRKGESSILLYAFEMTSEVDEKGYYKLTKHVLVELLLDDITELDLTDFSSGNILFGLTAAEEANGIRLTIDPCWGIGGSLLAKRVALKFTPIDDRPKDI
jgi:hypothetical protein